MINEVWTQGNEMNMNNEVWTDGYEMIHEQ